MTNTGRAPGRELTVCALSVTRSALAAFNGTLGMLPPEETLAA